LSIAGGLGSAAANSLGTFFVVYAVSLGLRPAHAAVYLMVASVLMVLSRVVLGHSIDRRGGDAFLRVALLVGAGAAGLMMLSFGKPILLIPAGLLAFAAGWGWPGLFVFGVMQESATPAASTGRVQAGIYIGSALGPPMFGLLTDRFSYRVGWLAASAAAIASASLFLWARLSTATSRSDADHRTVRLHENGGPR
jgi:predicted MFS family arabinose efflux permease